MFGSIGSAFEAAKAKLVAWRQREIARAELESLDDRALADIGLSRSDIALVLSGRHQRQIEPFIGAVETAAPANGNAARVRRVA